MYKNSFSDLAKRYERESVYWHRPLIFNKRDSIRKTLLLLKQWDEKFESKYLKTDVYDSYYLRSCQIISFVDTFGSFPLLIIRLPKIFIVPRMTKVKNWQPKTTYCSFLFSQLAKFDNELCKPRSTLVAIDKPSFKFFPYFVKLDRCGGSCNNIQPSIKSCVPLQYNEVSVSVKMVSTGETKIIKERNHTHCGCQCVITLDDCNLELEDWRPELCQCKCKFGDKPPTPCRDGFRWSKKDCRCICDKAPETCPSNKVWQT